MRHRTRRPVLMFWQGMLMMAVRKVRKSMVSRRRRCSLWCSAQRGVTGSRRAHQAFRVQASAAMVMYAQLAHSVFTGACRARTPDLSRPMRFSWLQRCRAVDHLVGGHVPVVGDVEQ